MSFERVIYKEIFSTTGVNLTTSDQTLLSFTAPITALYEIDFQASFYNSEDIDSGCDRIELSLYSGSTLIAFSYSHYAFASSSEYAFTQCAATSVMVDIVAGTTVTLRAKKITGFATTWQYEKSVKLNYVARQKVKLI